MKLQTVHVFLATLVFSGASHVLAQSTEPPPIIKIIRENMKPGKGAAHVKIESAYVRAFQKSKYPNYVAWEAMTGPTQAWFLEGYANYAGIEAASKIADTEPLKTTLDQLDAQDGELRTGESNMIARYSKDLSYLPAPPNLPKTHFYSVNVLRIRPGRNEDYLEMRKIEKAAFEKAGAKLPEVIYRIGWGAQAATYLLILPLESLKAMDEAVNWNTREVLGEQFERYRKLRADLIVSSEYVLFAVNPKMSNPPKAYADAEFWTPKPKPAAK